MNGQKHDETVEGGRYILGNNYVNADGEILGPVEENKEDELQSTPPQNEPMVVSPGATNVQPPAEPPTIFNTPPPVVSTE